MSDRENLQPGLRQQAHAMLGRLSPPEREALLIKCWMSHDARWFMAVAREYGLEAANRLNQRAAHALGEVEAGRVARALDIARMSGTDEYLLAQEILIGFLGPDLLDYQVFRLDGDSYEMHVERCFAHENVVAAGIAQDYECGIFARVTGHLDGLGIEYEMTPALGKCLKVEGRECVHTFRLRFEADSSG